MGGSTGTLSLFFPVFVPTSLAAAAYAGHRAMYVDWRSLITHFLTAPGRTSRMLLVMFLVLNWKSLPLAWTVRIFHAFLYHLVGRRKVIPKQALFHYSITSSRNSLLDTDYNMHKSNSTYFADLDISRSHLATHLLGPAMFAIGKNEKTKLVRDKEGNVVKGSFGMGLGAVFCSFRKEISPLQGYEMWSRILSWDRKWLYIITHYVVKGKVRPMKFDGKTMGPTRPRMVDAATGKPVSNEDWSKYVIATAVSKYVFKVGRFTVHPAIAIEASGLLPERPGAGWRGGDTETGTPDELGELDEAGEWDWRRVELERRRGMEYAEHFAALDGTNSLFNGGEEGSVGHFPIG